jgi:large conductance mechanosensitive channel
VPYGLFLAELVNFIIVAFALFLFIVKVLKAVMKDRKAEVAAAPPPPPAPEVVLLGEIRDLLKSRAQGADPR